MLWTIFIYCLGALGLFICGSAAWVHFFTPHRVDGRILLVGR